MKPDSGRPFSSLSYAWFVVAVLIFCNTLSFVDRQILGLLVLPIKRDLGISDTRIGLLQGLAFALFYVALGLPLGRISDRYSRRGLIAAGILLWSFMTGCCAAARSFWSLFLARLGVGVGEATLAPSAFSLISDYFPKERLGRAISAYSLGIFLGSGLALIGGGAVVDATRRLPAITLPLLGTIASWRLAFLIAGAPGLLAALLLMWVREPARRNLLLNNSGQPARLNVRAVIVEVWKRWRPVAGISLGMVFQCSCLYGFSAWAPTFFQRIHGWTPGQAGRTLGAIMIGGGCLGMYLGGALCDRWSARGMPDAALRVAILSGIGVGTFAVPAFLVHNAIWTVPLLVGAVFFIGMPIGSVFASLQCIFPNQVRAQVSAIHLFVLNMGGLTLGPLLPGVFNDYVFRSERAVGLSLALMIGTAAALQSLTFYATCSSYSDHYREMEILLVE